MEQDPSVDADRIEGELTTLDELLQHDLVDASQARQQAQQLVVVVQVYNDRSFDFVTKSPPAAALLKKAAGIAKGSGVPNKEKVGRVTVAQIDEICKQKMADLNARDIEHARHMIAGTARSMGIEVEG